MDLYLVESFSKATKSLSKTEKTNYFLVSIYETTAWRICNILGVIEIKAKKGKKERRKKNFLVYFPERTRKVSRCSRFWNVAQSEEALVCTTIRYVRNLLNWLYAWQHRKSQVVKLKKRRLNQAIAPLLFYCSYAWLSSLLLLLPFSFDSVTGGF